MSFVQEILPWLWVEQISGKTRALSDSFLQNLSESISTTACDHNDADNDTCRDEKMAYLLKMAAIFAILISGVFGVAIPLVGKQCRFLQTDSNMFFTAKAFAAGVILATGFVHMLPDATSALTDACLPKYPWSVFPFSGLFAMIAALATLVVDFVATQYYEKKQERQNQVLVDMESVESTSELGSHKVFGEEDGGVMHIVGMHAHAAHHRHNHPHGQKACEGHIKEQAHGLRGDKESGVRHVVVSQFFEGFALGGCISQAQFKTLHANLMACFFAITTPLGIAIGAAISSIYNPNSPRALVVEGIFDSVSAGILVYMALVDLIAADFLSKRMSCNVRLQAVSYFALFLGAVLMSSLALWA